MKTYFDIEKAEADMRAAYQTALEQARRAAKDLDDLALVEVQARFIPARILITITLLELYNEQVDRNLAAEALAATVAGIIKNCADATPGDRFFKCLMTDLKNFMTGNLSGYSDVVYHHTAEPLS